MREDERTGNERENQAILLLERWLKGEQGTAIDERYISSGTSGARALLFRFLRTGGLLLVPAVAMIVF